MKLEINTNGAWKTILAGLNEARAAEARLAVAELSRLDVEIHAEAGKKSGKPATWRLVSEGDGRVVSYCTEGAWAPRRAMQERDE